MSLGKHVLSKHAQSRNDLNLENISVITICSGSVSILTKKVQMDLKYSEHVFDRLVFKCPVDNTVAISGQRERDSVNIAHA